jgi:hypothetical protein
MNGWQSNQKTSSAEEFMPRWNNGGGAENLVVHCTEDYCHCIIFVINHFISFFQFFF